MSETNTIPSEESQALDWQSPDVIIGTSIIGIPMVLTAVRCTAQYILLPFVLPIFGLGGAFSTTLNILVEGFALGLIVYNLVRLWPTRWRWRYLGLSAIMIPIIGLTLLVDVRLLMGF